MSTSSEADRFGGDLEGFHAALAGQYTIERELGRGGHSLVFLAQDLQNNRPVAIKILRPELALHVATERFLREIEITAKLQHPHILPLFSSGSAAGHAYYVMPYVEGESLDAYLGRMGPLPLDEALRLVGEVAEALQYAHHKGVVHRDIKPGNILLSGGHALVADFGVARALRVAGDSTITGEGTVIGSPHYMPPEQAGGSGPVDARSDQYALAVVLYEMLAGQPPFTGPSLQAVIARQLAEPPPPLRVVRPAVTPAMQAVIERALAKVPGDRWASVAEFAVQLASTKAVRPSRWRRVAAAAGLLTAAAVTWRIVVAGGPELDPNKVVVFPLIETGAGAGREGVGEEASIFLVNALAHTEPLKWEDGWRWFTAEQRREPAAVTVADYRRIARRVRARWYVEGTLSRRGDFVTIVLRLTEAATNDVVAREDGGGTLVEFAQAALRTINELLPRLLAPDRAVDLTALTDREPGAVASWLQGEREYRRLGFEAALPFLERAVAQDSALAVAALRGAQAASWINRMETANALAHIAFSRLDLLSSRQADFARGFVTYLVGHADSAVFWLQRALAASPDWTEAHMLLGEVYYHLLPTTDSMLETLAEREFLMASRDTGFAPPWFHLAEIALRRGDARLGSDAVDHFRAVASDPRASLHLGLMLSCVQSGRTSVGWTAAALRAPLETVAAAKALAMGGAFMDCAEDGFRAVLASPGVSPAHQWGAILGLQGILAAQARTTELRAFVDSVSGGLFAIARRAYVLDAIAGVPVEAEASAFVDALGPAPSVVSQSPTSAWLLGIWSVERLPLARAQAIRDALANAAESRPHLLTQRLAKALDARVRLRQGDTTSAVALLRSILPFGERYALEWEFGDPLPAERLLLAQLLLSQGKAQEASVVADAFDRSPVAYLPFLPASLQLRLRAAELLQDESGVTRYRERLNRLGVGNAVSWDSCGHLTSESVYVSAT